MPPPPRAPHPVPTSAPPADLVREAAGDVEKKAALDHMLWCLSSGQTRDQRKEWWTRYLVENHADHHPEWREAELEDFIVRQVELCDFVKRAKGWFLN